MTGPLGRTSGPPKNINGAFGWLETVANYRKRQNGVLCVFWWRRLALKVSLARVETILWLRKKF